MTSPSTSPSPTPSLAARREVWVDSLRVILIAGVLVLHTATGYVLDFAGWYYDDEVQASGMVSKVLTGPALLGGLFWLGPFFVLAGWFSARSLAGRGPGGFARARLVRLGVPLLVFVLLLNPLTDYLGNVFDERGSFAFYLRQTEVGALWFVAALLVFSLGYAALRRWHGPADASGRLPDGAAHPWLRLVLAAMVAIAVTSWLVWLRWPLTEEAVLNLKFSEWPQGAVLFALGVHAAETGWVDRPPSLHQVRALGWTALAGAIGFVALVAVGVSSDSQDDLGPATDWPVISAAVLDGIVAVSFTVWFLVWFRTRAMARARAGDRARAGAGSADPRWQALIARAGRASYATYVVHPLVITLIMLALSSVPLGPWIKVVIVSLLAVPACFAAGDALTRAPGLSRIL